MKVVEPEVRNFLKKGGRYPESETQRKETEDVKVQSKETRRGQTVQCQANNTGNGDIAIPGEAL